MKIKKVIPIREVDEIIEAEHINSKRFSVHNIDNKSARIRWTIGEDTEITDVIDLRPMLQKQTGLDRVDYFEIFHEDEEVIGFCDPKNGLQYNPENNNGVFGRFFYHVYQDDEYLSGISKLKLPQFAAFAIGVLTGALSFYGLLSIVGM